MTTGTALQIRLGIAKKHAVAALQIAFANQMGREREQLILTAIESLEEAMDPNKDEMRELMEETSP